MIPSLPTSMTGKIFYKRARIHRKNIKVYWQTLGLWGTLATLPNLVLGYPEYITIAPEGVKHPLFLRLGTSDVEVYRDTFLQGEYDYPTLFSPRTIVDVGANCGMTTVFYTNRYPDATVVALEPEASNYAALVRNTRAYPKVIPIHGALWHTDGEVEVFPPWPRWKQWGKWGFRVRQGNGCRAFALTTLMREVGMETIDILKIDVEGAERDIFSGCDWMDKVRLLAIELHDRETPGCSDAVKAVARRHQKTERGLVTFYVR